MKVGIDLDGVVFDFVGAFTRQYENWFGFPLAGEITKWDDPLRLSHFSEYPDLFDWCDRANVWRDCAYIPGARAGIARILDQGHQVSFVTSRHGAGAETATQWARANFAAGSSLQVSIATDLHNHKWQVPCSIYIEDSPAVIKELQTHDKQVVIFDQPWNAGVKGNRAKSWLEVIGFLDV